MQAFWETVASNALLVVVLAVGVALLGRLWKNPLCLHLLWLLVLLKLVTPPLLTVPIALPASQAPLASEACDADQLPVYPLRLETPPTIFPAMDSKRRQIPDDRAIGSPMPGFDVVRPVAHRPEIPWLSILGWTWGCGVVASACWQTCRIVRFRRLLRCGIAPSSAVLGMAAVVGRRLGLRRLPDILILPVRLSPLVWSLGGRPRVLLPAALFEQLDRAAREAILAHELAHVRRKDHWVRLLEVIITTLFWWHPAAWWAAGRLRELEDQCCDGMVVDMMPHGAKGYATALLDTLDFLSDTSVAVPRGATAAKSSISLSRRIAMLQNRSWDGRLGFGHLIALLIVAAPAMALALAEKPQQPAADPPSGSAPQAAAAPAAKAEPAKADDAELRQSARNLRDIMSAVHMYHQVAGHYPAARYGWGYDRKAKEWFRQRPYLSWRVLLLPMLGQKDLFAKFRTDEPWDSERNRKLIPLMPNIYRAPGSKAGEGKTKYLGVVGPDAAFPEKGTIMVQDFIDGTSNTIMLVEAPDHAAVEWTQPDDFPVDTKEPVKKLMGLRPGGFLTALADGSPQFISENITPKTLRLLLIRNDRESFGEAEWKACVHFIPPAPAASSPPAEPSSKQARTTVDLELRGGEIVAKAVGQPSVVRKTSEQAIAAALNWLYRHQTPQGNWSIDYRRQCKGETCSGAGLARSDAAATAMALLPFLAAGETPKSKGPYRQTVAKALDWLVKQQKPNGDLSGGCEQPLHAHGLATIALCEAYGMTHDEQLGAAAGLGVGYIERAQNEATGGWGPSPGDAGNTSTFGWQIMALKSAQLAGLPVKASVLPNAERWLRSVAKGEKLGLYANQPSGEATPAMTAVGMFARQLMGAGPKDPALLEAKRYLLANLPDSKLARNSSYWYCGTLALHAFSDADWMTWSRKTRQPLIETQVKQGCAAGSWDPDQPTPDAEGKNGGRLMTTSLSVLSLEVYYRYLPLFRVTTAAAPGGRTRESPEKAGKPPTSIFLGGYLVTDDRLEDLKGLVGLQSLSLANSQVTDAGLERLKDLANLQSLDLTFTKVTDAGLATLKRFPQLRSLNLHGIGVTDVGLEQLNGSTHLRSLSLYGTKVTDAGLVHIEGLPQLRSLDLGATRVTGAGMEHLKGLAQLRSLELIWTGMTDEGFASLEGLSQLESLNLWACNISDAGLQHVKNLSQLRSLNLGRTGVTNVGIEHLKALTNLESLNLVDTRVTDAGINTLQTVLPRCAISGRVVPR